MYRRIAGLCGIMGPVVAFACIIAAILVSPWFSWSDNALSDLGVSPAAPVFNGGLFAGGALNVVFAAGLLASFRGSAVKMAGAVVLLAASVALACIGVFNESFVPTHYLVSVLFFVLAPVAILVIAAAMLYRPDTRALGYLSVVVVAIAIGTWFLPRGSGVDVPEAIAALSASVWTIVMGARLYLQRE